MRKNNNLFNKACVKVHIFFTNLCTRIKNEIKYQQSMARQRKKKKKENIAYLTVLSDDETRNYIFADECSSCKNRKENQTKSKCVKINTNTVDEEGVNPYYINSLDLHQCTSFEYNSDSSNEEDAYNSIESADSSGSLDSSDSSDAFSKNEPIVSKLNKKKTMSYETYYNQVQTKQREQLEPLLNNSV
jgi:hypothetical protein